jgi:hypothetical protein
MALVPLAMGALASSVSARDRAGDVKSGDLDVVAASLTRRGGRITATFRLLEPVRDNAIYVARLSSRGKLVELGAKRAAGHTTIYVLDFNSGRRVSASGAMRGLTVTSAGNGKAPVTRAFQWWAHLGLNQGEHKPTPSHPGRNWLLCRGKPLLRRASAPTAGNRTPLCVWPRRGQPTAATRCVDARGRSVDGRSPRRRQQPAPRRRRQEGLAK